MKYFKVTNVDDPEEEFYVSSTLPNESPAHIAMTLHLGSDGGRYNVVEVTKEEFDRETEDEEDDLDGLSFRRDLDFEDDYDWDDDDVDCFCD